MTTNSKRPDGGEFKRIPIPKVDTEWFDHEAIEKVRKAAFALNPAEQYRLAFFVAENVGYVLEREPDHPDSPHATPTNESPAPQAEADEYSDAFVADILAADAAAPESIISSIDELTAPQPPVEGLRGATPIKQLDWQETFVDRGDGSTEQSGWEADNGFSSWYSVEQYFASDSYGWQVKFDCDVIGDFDDPDQAKVCAQSHFEIRILAALASPSLTAALSQQPVAVADREAIAGEFEPVGTQYLHYSPFTGREVWLDRDFYNGHRATVSREVFARKSALALLQPPASKG